MQFMRRGYKEFQIYEGTSLLLTVPIAYLALEFYHISPEICHVYLPFC